MIKLKKVFFIVLLLLSCNYIIGTTNTTISGYIRDSETGEELIGTSIFVDSIQQSVISNSYGFYSLTIPQGSYVINYSFLGYSTIKIKILLIKDTVINIKFNKDTLNLKEVVISANNIKQRNNNVKKLTMEEVKQLPSVFGEQDIIKAIQLQSGVKNIGEGSSGLYIRGGNRDQNYILIDEAPIYNISHLYGFVSVFNPDMVKDVKIYSTCFPSNYGGRVSSVIDTKMKEGNLYNYSINGGLSILAGRLAIEGPIIKDKTSFLLTARRSFIDFILRPKSTYMIPMFYDLNSKINYKINEKNRLFFSMYHGYDQIDIAEISKNKWQNTTATLRWNYLMNKKTFLNTSLIYSDYKNDLVFKEQNDSLKQNGWRTGVNDLHLKMDYNWYINPLHTVRCGLNSIYHKYIPGESDSINLSISRINAIESSAYLLHEAKITHFLTINYGLRYTLFQNIGNTVWYSFNDRYLPIVKNIETNKSWNSYQIIEPRICLDINKDKKNSYQIAYTKASQFVQIISNNSYSYSALETWMPASPNIKPLLSDNFSTGYFLNQEKFSFSVEGYYRLIQNQIDYVDHANLFNNPYIEGELRRGKANAYGLEFNIKKESGKTTGSISYVYSRVFYNIKNVTLNDVYRAPYDIPHDFRIQILQKISTKIKISTFWTFASGRPATFPIGFYSGSQITEDVGGVMNLGSNWNFAKIPIYSERNSDQFPNYHRLDIAFIFDPPAKRKMKHNLSIGVYNLYARRNPLGYDFNSRKENAVLVYHFIRFIPNFSYNFKFN